MMKMTRNKLDGFCCLKILNTPPPPPTHTHTPLMGGGGVERDQIWDIRPRKKSNIRYHTAYKIKYQISDPKKNQISDISRLLQNQISLGTAVPPPTNQLLDTDSNINRSINNIWAWNCGRAPIIRSVCTVDPGVPPERGAHLDRGVATPRSRCREVRHSSREFLKENPRWLCVNFDTSIKVFRHLDRGVLGTFCRGTCFKK